MQIWSSMLCVIPIQVLVLGHFLEFFLLSSLWLACWRHILNLFMDAKRINSLVWMCLQCVVFYYLVTNPYPFISPLWTHLSPLWTHSLHLRVVQRGPYHLKSKPHAEVSERNWSAVIYRGYAAKEIDIQVEKRKTSQGSKDIDVKI